MSTWFGRSRVQDRTGDSDERGAMDDPAARRNDPDPRNDLTPQRAGWVDEKVVAAEGSSARAASNGRDSMEPDHGRAIDALRAATTAAGDGAVQPSIDDIAQIRRLHEMRLDAELGEELLDARDRLGRFHC